MVAFAEKLGASAGAHEAVVQVMVAGAGIGRAQREANGNG
jgi:hypothetical protein